MSPKWRERLMLARAWLLLRDVPRWMLSIALLLLLVLLAGRVLAADAWNEDTVSWTASNACERGAPASNCVVTGYRLETAAAETSAWLPVTTVPATTLTYTVPGLTAGQHCYRVVALSVVSADPTNPACAMTMQPQALLTSDTVAYEIRGTTILTATRVGLVPLGIACGPESKTVGGTRYNRLPLSAADLINWPYSLRLTEVWVKCSH